MRKSEVAELLTFIAAFDRRTIGETDVEAWSTLPSLQRTDLRTAKMAVVLFFDTEPPARGEAPYLDPHELRKYIRLAHEREVTEEARDRARRPQLTAAPGAYAPPEDFREKLAAAIGGFGAMP